MARNGKATTLNGVNQTVFTCASTEARSVFLAGTFNGWDTESTPMERQPDSTWRTTLDLAPGPYEYKFVVDGAWCCDPAPEGIEALVRCVPNPFGTMNYATEVPGNTQAREAKASAAA